MNPAKFDWTDPVTARHLDRLDEAVERHYPRYERTAHRPAAYWWRPTSDPQQCERCGSVIFLVEDGKGARYWFQVMGARFPDHVAPKGTPTKCKFLRHDREQCTVERDRAGAAGLASLLADPAGVAP